MVMLDQLTGAALVKSCHGLQVGSKALVITNGQQQFPALNLGRLVLVIVCALVEPSGDELMRGYPGGLVHPYRIEENGQAGVSDGGI